MQHFEIQDQIPLYAVGGLSAAEFARVAEHLAVCSQCRVLLSEYQMVADELAENVPAQIAPARVGVRLQNIAAADVRNARRSVSSSGARFWNQPIALPRWAFALALLAVLLALGAASAFTFQALQRNAPSEQVLQLLNARDLKFVELKSATEPVANRGIICIQPDNSTALLWLYNLEPLDSTHVYQVWLRYDGARDNGGTFRADWEGRAVKVIQAPRPFKQYQEIGITVEPASGSQAPTTPRVVGGRLD